MTTHKVFKNSEKNCYLSFVKKIVIKIDNECSTEFAKLYPCGAVTFLATVTSFYIRHHLIK